MPDQPVPSPIWGSPGDLDDLDEAMLVAALRRDRATLYGLSLVVGCPLPIDVRQELDALKAAIETLAPLRIRWRAAGAWHLTVFGLKRSRQRRLAQGEIGGLLERLEPVVRGALSGEHCLRLPLGRPAVGPDGAVLLATGESGILDELRLALGRLAGVDPLHVGLNHITLGRFVRPFGSVEAYRSAVALVRALEGLPGGDLVVDRFQVVYYRNRTLEDVIWQAPILL